MTTEQTKVAVLKLVNNLVKAGELISVEYGMSIFVGTNLRIYSTIFQSDTINYRKSQVDLNKITILEGDDAQYIYDEVLKLKVADINNLLANQ